MRILSIDAWREPEGGWTWNNYWQVGSIEKAAFEALEDKPRKVFAWLRKEGILTAASAGCVALDDDQHNLVVVDKNTREPLVAIEYGAEY